jgi:hypothetical protein
VYARAVLFLGVPEAVELARAEPPARVGRTASTSGTFTVR